MTDRPFPPEVLKALKNGEIRKANEYIGGHFFLEGDVIRGRQLGRELGFPTANIRVPDPSGIMIANGIYAGYATIGTRLFPGMIHVGNRPTIQGAGFSIEIHLFGFSGNLYDQTIRISFVEKLRDELTFSSLAELEEQLKKDRDQSLALLQPLFKET